MFERFTQAARDVVVLAQEQARTLRHGYIGTEHLLLGILGKEDCAGARALERLGINYATMRSDLIREVGEGQPGDPEKDTEALRTIGIDLDEVRRRVEEDFGPGALERADRSRRRRKRRCDPIVGLWSAHISFTPRAKKVLELSLREALQLGHGYIGTEHIVLGIAREGQGLAAGLLDARGAPSTRIRQAVAQELARGGDSPGRSA